MRDGNHRLVLFSACGRESFSLGQQRELESVFEVEFVPAPESFSEKAFYQFLKGRDVAGITPRALPQKLSAGFWSRISRLDTVYLPTTGTEWFPVAEVEASGIVVRNLPGYSGQSTAEFAWLLLLALQRHLLAANRRVLTGSPEKLLGRELSGRKLGIVGCGDVGRRVARFGEAFGMQVAVFDLKDVSGFRNASLETLFEESDVLSIHLPLTEETQALFTESLFAKIKKGALIVNTARPALIDFGLMERCLNEELVGGYAVDQGYFSRTEMLPLARHPKVLAVPHISWYTVESIEREMALWVNTMTTHARRRPLAEFTRES